MTLPPRLAKIIRMTPTNSNHSRSYAVVGTGAMGGYYGACLARAGIDVHFLARSDYAHIREHGLRVDSKFGNFTLPNVQVHDRVASMPPSDVVLVALKTTQNHLLPALLPPLLKPEGVALALQNGLGVESEIAQIVGAGRVIGGLCFLCSNKVGPGHVHHLDYGMITIGEYSPDGKPGGITERMRAVAADFERAAIPINLADDLVTARWQKLMWNITFNGLSVVLDATTDAIMANPASRLLAESVMREVRAAAHACGRDIPEDFMHMLLANTSKMTPYRTSMKVDYDERRPMEVEAIFGAPLHAARFAGADSPRLEMLYHQLQFLDARNQLPTTNSPASSLD